MLNLLRRAQTVHRATTRAEREAVYRFRYEIYVEEYGRELGTPDHEKRWVADHDDEAPTTTILYTGTPERITSTVRVRHWAAGQVPQHDVEELSLDRIPGAEALRVGEIGRLMVRRTLRGKLILASFLREVYHLLSGEQGSDIVLCYCSPGLVRFYQHFGMLPFGGRLVPAPDGMMVPLVALLSDRQTFRRVGSMIAPLVRRYFGPGKRPVHDPRRFIASTPRTRPSASTRTRCGGPPSTACSTAPARAPNRSFSTACPATPCATWWARAW